MSTSPWPGDMQYFNPRSLVGNDPIGGQGYDPLPNFNPRSLVGNDRKRGVHLPINTISIHVPSWGTTHHRRPSALQRHISIHVPSWGTTFFHLLIVRFFSISIHVPSWGTTIRFRNRQVSRRYFNPRSLVGND